MTNLVDLCLEKTPSLCVFFLVFLIFVLLVIKEQKRIGLEKKIIETKTKAELLNRLFYAKANSLLKLFGKKGRPND